MVAANHPFGAASFGERTAKSITFSVLGRPQAKQSTRIARTKGGRILAFQSTKIRNAENSFLAQAVQFRPETPHVGPVWLFLTFQFKLPESWPAWKKALVRERPSHVQKPDLDNLQKLAIDSMKGVFFADDSQVTLVSTEKNWGDTDETWVKIELIEPLPERCPKEKP